MPPTRNDVPYDFSCSVPDFGTSGQLARHTLDGAFWIMVSQSLLAPIGLAVVVFLTRQFGPAGYGQYALTWSVVFWIEISVCMVFSRSAVRLVGETDDWRALAAALLKWNLALGLGAMLLLWLIAEPIATLLGDRQQAGLIRLAAIDIPIAAFAEAHISVLMGLGRFRHRAAISAARWISRLVLIVLFVELGFSVEGALCGGIGSSVVSLMMCRMFLRPKLFCGIRFPARQLWGHSLPLFITDASLRALQSIDLLLLVAWGGTQTQAGLYAAASNLAFFPAMIGVVAAPVVLSTVTRLLKQGRAIQARATAEYSMRLVLVLLPFVVLVSVTSTEILQLVLGADFAAGGPLMAVLIFAAYARFAVAIISSLLVASGHLRATVMITAPVVPIAVLSHFVLIPMFGPLGAAVSTTFAFSLLVVAGLFAVEKVWDGIVLFRTFYKSLVVGLLVCGTVFWPAPGLWLILKLVFVCLAIVGLILAQREFSRRELDFVTRLIGLRTPEAAKNAI